MILNDGQGSPRDPEVVKAQNRANAETGPFIRDLRPEEDFSDEASAQRRKAILQGQLAELKRLREEASELSSQPVPQAPAGGWGGIKPEGRSSSDVARDTAALLAAMASDQKQAIQYYPSLQKALVEAVVAGSGVTEKDILRVTNYAEARRAATAYINASRLTDADGNNTTQTNILMSANPVQRAAILDVVRTMQSGVEFLETSDTNWLQAGLSWAVSTGLAPFVWANDTAQHTYRALGVNVDNSDTPALDNAVWNDPLGPLSDWGDRWAATEKGQFDETYIQELRDSGRYSPLAVDIVTDISRRTSEGDPDPISSTIADPKYASNPEADLIFRGLVYRPDEDENLMELVRQVDSANRGSTGQLVLTTALTPGASEYSEFRGTKGREVGANAASVFYSFALDPTIAGAKVVGAYRAARYALTKLAPAAKGGAAAALRSQKVAGVETNAARKAVQAFVDDLVKYDDLVARDPAAAATLRTVIARQHKEFPEDVIDEFQKQGIRTVDDFAAFVDETNDAFLLSRGEPTLAATAVTRAGESNFAREPLAMRMSARGDMGRREALMPRSGPVKRLRQKNVQWLSAHFAPKKRGRQTIESFYGNTDDVAQVTERLGDNALDAGRADQELSILPTMPGSGALGRRVDGFTRLFSSLPSVNHITTFDARDAGQFYKFARTYLTRQNATFLTNAFRDGNPAQRRLMVAGLIRTAAAARGVSLSKGEALAGIDDLATGWRVGERYSATKQLRANPEPIATSTLDSPANLAILDADASAMAALGDTGSLTPHVALRASRERQLAEKYPDKFKWVEGEDAYTPGRLTWDADKVTQDEFVDLWMAEYFPQFTPDSPITLYRGLTSNTGKDGVFSAGPGGAIGEGNYAYWTLSPAVAHNFAGLASSEGKVAVLRTTPRELAEHQKGRIVPGRDKHAEYAVTLDYTTLPQALKDSVRVVDIQDVQINYRSADMAQRADDIFHGGSAPDEQPFDESTHYMVSRVDNAADGVSWDKPQGLYTAQVKPGATNPHWQAISDDAGDAGVIELTGHVARSDVFDVTPVRISMDGLRGSEREIGTTPFDADAGVGYLLNHVPDADGWVAAARNGNGRTMSEAFRAKLEEFDNTVDWDAYYDNYERLMAVGGIQARRDGHKAIRMVDDSMVQWGGEDLTEIVILDKSVFAQQASKTPEQIVEDTIQYRPSNFDGEEHALHLWQTTQAVAIPSIRDLEALKRYRELFPFNLADGALTRVPQQATDFWSAWTLAGLRFSVRSAVEDLWVYAVTKGSMPMLYAGRRASTGVREARAGLALKRYKHDTGRHKKGDLVLDADGNATVVVQSRLGMFGKRFRKAGDSLAAASPENKLADVLGTFFLQNLDENAVIAAQAAARGGDLVPLQRLVVQAIGRTRMNGLTDEQLSQIGDLVLTPFGLKYLDEVAEAGQFLSRGTMPVLDDTKALDIEGMTAVKIPERQATVLGGFKDVSGDDWRFGTFWFNSLEGIVSHDGPIGKIAVANLYNRDQAIARIADAIRNDTKFGYQTQFSALYTGKATVEQFAARYYDDVRNMFSGPDGSINAKLFERLAPKGPDGVRQVGLHDIDEVTGERTLRITPNGMGAFRKDGAPEIVLGRESIPAPTEDLGSYISGDRMFTWMGEQYARISKEPLFIANYLEQRGINKAYQAQLAERIGEKAANKVVAKMSADRAYGFVLSYTDNPANRSQLAWKVRNVSRYYRATEDFYRRMQRVAKNYPEAFWKTALTYDVLDDTGFVFTDDNGDKYFAYPGNEFLQGAVTAALGGVFGMGDMGIDPYFIGGKVKMLAPSTDPNQAFPQMMGPIGVIPMKMLFDKFPAIKGFERYVLGEYSAQSEWWDAIFPGQVARILGMLTVDERESLYGSAIKDAMAIAVSQDLLKDKSFDQDGITSTDQLLQGNMEEWRLLQKIAMGGIATKALMGFFPVPASPQLYVDNVTLFARAHGLDNMRDGFLDSVAVFEKQGSANPFGDAIAKWWALHPDGDLMPFTVSKTQVAEGKINALADVQSVEGLQAWWKDNKELYEEFPNAALFLAPRTGDFSWGAYDLVTSTLGLRYGKDFDRMAMDLLVADDQSRYFATYDDYQQDIDALNPATDAEAIKKLKADRTADLEYLKSNNRLLARALGTDYQALDGNAQVIYDDTKRMTQAMFDRGIATPVSTGIANAIATYEDYMSDIRGITGSTTAEDEYKRNLKLGLEADLAALSGKDENVAHFVDTVLKRTPEFQKAAG